MTLYEFYNKYFLVNLNDYSNIGIDLEISKILFYLLAGLIIVAVIINYRRAARILIIKKLLQHEIFSEDSAKTLTELEIESFGIRLALSLKGRLSGIVMRAGEKKYTLDKCLKKEKIDFNYAKFYLNSESLTKAQKMVDVPAPSVIKTLLLCILLIAIYILIIMLIPELLTFINNILS